MTWVTWRIYRVQWAIALALLAASALNRAHVAASAVTVAAGAALLALLVVAAVGMLVRAPLRRVPENAIKFVVGSMLLSFGTLWTMEALATAAVWWNGDLSLIPLLGIYLGGGLLIAQWMRVTSKKAVEVQ